jgi:predicted dehydrogenase
MQNRRHFLCKSAAAFAGVQILPSSVFGANEKLNIAFVGAGGKGWHAVQSLLENDLVNHAAFADVDEPRAAQSRQARPKTPFYSDFRKMLDQQGKNIDAVIISTPDHTHHFNAKTCMSAGKHVYVEKPLAHSIAETRDLMALEKQTGLACQMGNQGHSGGGILMLEEWAKAGIIGDVTEAYAWAGPKWSVPDARPAGATVPAGLDWDQWLGPAAMVPYSSKYLPGAWRAWYEFGCGTLGDWACHNMDAPFHVWALNCPSKVEIESSGPSKLSFPKTVRLTFTFPATSTRGEFKLHWFHGENHAMPRPPELEAERKFPEGGTIIRGSKATVLMGTHAGTPRVIPELKMREMVSTLPKVNLKRSDHWNNWLLAIKGQEACRSSFAYGGRLTEAMHYGNIALHLNRSLTINPVTRSILGDEEGVALMSGPAAREGWKI